MAKPNKYLSFISDEHFSKAIEHVRLASQSASEDFLLRYSLKQFSKEIIDPFKMLFDLYDIRQSGYKEWVKGEIERQLDKTINNKIGEFHQLILGGVPGWQDLGVGHESEIDLAKEDNSMFIELKNKHNTMNSSSAEKCGDKLMAVLAQHPEAKAYWGYIVAKNPIGGEAQWSYKKNRKTISHPNLYKAWGSRVYEIVTGNPAHLRETWLVLNRELANKGFIGSIIDRNKIIDQCTTKIISEIGKQDILEFFFQKACKVEN